METTTKTTQQEEIENFVQHVHETTGLSTEQIKLDMLSDCVARAKNEYHEEDEYPEIDGVKGGCGHSAEEIIFSSQVAAIGCGLMILALFVLAVIMIIRHFQ